MEENKVKLWDRIQRGMEAGFDAAMSTVHTITEKAGKGIELTRLRRGKIQPKGFGKREEKGITGMDMSKEHREPDREPGADDVLGLDERRQVLKACRQESEQRLQSMLRARADLDNLRKRTDREMADTRKFAVANLLEALLPVMDSLGMGLSASMTSLYANTEAE